MTHALNMQLGIFKMRFGALAQQAQPSSEEEYTAFKARCGQLEDAITPLAQRIQDANPDLTQTPTWGKIRTLIHNLSDSIRNPSASIESLNTGITVDQPTIDHLINPLIAALAQTHFKSPDSSPDSTLDESLITGFEAEYTPSQFAFYLMTSLTRKKNCTILETFKKSYSDFLLILHHELDLMSSKNGEYSEAIRTLFKERSPQIFNRERLIGLVLLTCIFETKTTQESPKTTTLENLSSISSLEKSQFSEKITTIRFCYGNIPPKNIITPYLLQNEIPGNDELNSIIASLDFNLNKRIFTSTKTTPEDNIFLFSLFFQDILTYLKPPDRKKNQLLQALNTAYESLEPPTPSPNRNIQVLHNGSSTTESSDASQYNNSFPSEDEEPAADPETISSSDSSPLRGQDPHISSPLNETAQAVLHRLIALYMNGFEEDFFTQCSQLTSHGYTSTIMSILAKCFCEGNFFKEAIKLIKESPLNSSDKDVLFEYVARYLHTPDLLKYLNDVIESIDSPEIRQYSIQSYLQNIPVENLPLHLNCLISKEDENGAKVVNMDQMEQLARFFRLAARESSSTQNSLTYHRDLEQPLSLVVIHAISAIATNFTPPNDIYVALFSRCPGIFCDLFRIEYFENLLQWVSINPELKIQLYQTLLTLDIDTLKLSFRGKNSLELHKDLLKEREKFLASIIDTLVSAREFSKAYQLIDKVFQNAGSSSRKVAFDYAATILYRLQNNPQAASRFLEAAKRECSYDNFPVFRKKTLEERLDSSDHHYLVYSWTKLLLADGISLHKAFDTPPDLFEEKTFLSLQFFNTLFTQKELSADAISSLWNDFYPEFKACTWAAFHAAIHAKDPLQRFDQRKDLFDSSQDIHLSSTITAWIEDQPLDRSQKNHLYYFIIHYLVMSEKLPTSFDWKSLDDLMIRIEDSSLKNSLEKTLFAYFEWNTLLEPAEAHSVFINHLAFTASQRRDKKIHPDNVHHYLSMNRNHYSATSVLGTSVLAHFAQHNRKNIPPEYESVLDLLIPDLKGAAQIFWREKSEARDQSP